MPTDPDAYQEKITLGLRLRRLRLTQGITTEAAARASGVAGQTWTRWERGHAAYRPWRAPKIAAALGIPVAQLFTDACVLAEITVSDDTLARVRNEGRQVSEAAASRIAGQLEPLIFEAATRAPVDLRPGARAAKRRRTRAEKLAGIRAAGKARAAAEARRAVSQAPAFTTPDQ